jgi:hypothetical protein
VGLEDIRLFSEEDFFCTCLETNVENQPQICWGTYDKATGEVSKLVPLSVTEKIQCEKNWMPFYDTYMEKGKLKSSIHFIYSFEPFRRYRVNMHNGKVTLCEGPDKISRYSLTQFRGGSPLVPYEKGWLATIHQVFYSTPRQYFHRFIWLNREFTQIKFTRPFYFFQVDIEFNLSVIPDEEDLIVTYSVHDNNPHIARVPRKQLIWTYSE